MLIERAIPERAHRDRTIACPKAGYLQFGIEDYINSARRGGSGKNGIDSNSSIRNGVQRNKDSVLELLCKRAEVSMFDRRQVYISLTVLAIFELAVAALYAAGR